MKEIDDFVASIEDLVAEVSSDLHQSDPAVTEEEQQAMMSRSNSPVNNNNGTVDTDEEGGFDDTISALEDASSAATDLATNQQQQQQRHGSGGIGSRRRRFQRRFGRLRVGRPSWWTECKNIETTGCSFVFLYLILSFILMTTMFNMREIVGDYCLGAKERKEREHQANVLKAIQLRRRSPYDADQEDRFEKEIVAQLYYDKQGQLADDAEYLKNHRVPLTLPSDEYDLDMNDDDLVLLDFKEEDQP